MVEIAPNFRAIDPSDPAFTSPQFVPRQIGFSAVVDDLVVNVVRHHIVACPNIYLGMIAKYLPETQIVVKVQETLDFKIRVTRSRRRERLGVPVRAVHIDRE